MGSNSERKRLEEQHRIFADSLSSLEEDQIVATRLSAGMFSSALTRVDPQVNAILYAESQEGAGFIRQAQKEASHLVKKIFQK